MLSINRSSLLKFSPSRRITFNTPHPSDSSHLLRFAILDSPHLSFARNLPFQIAALIVPRGRESDWIFSTASGHLQLLLSSSTPIVRLFLVAEVPLGFPDHPSPSSFKLSSNCSSKLEDFLQPLFLFLSPEGTGNVPVVHYEDNVVSSHLLARSCGEFAGEMLVENVEIWLESEGNRRYEFRRRLRFKRLPIFVQTEMALVPVKEDPTRFNVDHMNLVYLAPMVAATSIIGKLIDSLSRAPKALCLGVGGGALLSFLKRRLGFDVLGVEIDEEVIRIAKKHFGLELDSEIFVGDAMEVMRMFSMRDGKKFEVIMVDLDSRDAERGCASPPNFAGEEFLSLARGILTDSGIVVMNTIPVNGSFYSDLLACFRKVFDELYEIAFENGENFVVVGRMSFSEVLCSDCQSSAFNSSLNDAISGKFMDSIRRL